jgi:hypothetical protein
MKLINVMCKKPLQWAITAWKVLMPTTTAQWQRNICPLPEVVIGMARPFNTGDNVPSHKMENVVL